jgi:arginase
MIIENIASSIKHNSALIGSASGWGAQLRETELGPQKVKSMNFLEKLYESNINCFWKGTLNAEKSFQEIILANGIDTLPYIVDHNKNIASEVLESLSQGLFPCVIGGDHSVAIGTWSAVSQFCKKKAQESEEDYHDMGLIWVDAHMDAHTPQTSQSHAYHGMPVAALMGYGEKDLTHISFKGAKLKPQNLVFIGVRSYEREEQELLNRLGVKIYYAEDVMRIGMNTVMKDAIEKVSKNTVGFGISIDLDAFDPADAPGVGSPESGGLRVSETIESFNQLQNHKKLLAMEIVELNPEKDHDNKTANLVYELLLRILPR